MKKITLKVISILIITILSISSVSACVALADRVFDPVTPIVEFYYENLADFSDTQNSWKEIVALGTIGYDFNDSNFVLPDFPDIYFYYANREIFVLRQATEILAMRAMGINPFNQDGRNLVREFTDFVGNPANADAITDILELNETLVIFYALNAVNRLEYFEHFIPRILELQNEEYGWFDYGWGEDSDMVSMTILALQPYIERLPEVAEAVEFAREYLRNSQLPNGGFLSSPLWGNEANANSTAMAILAINALSENPRDWNTFATYEGLGGDPIIALMRFSLHDGSFGADFGTGIEFNEMATQDAFVALAAMDLRENVFANLRNIELAYGELPYEEEADGFTAMQWIWAFSVIGLILFGVISLIILLANRRR